MNRPLVTLISMIVLAAAGIGTYFLGARLGSSPVNVVISGTEFQNPVDVSGVSLKTEDDKTVTLSDYRDKVTLVFFAWTRCPDVCPITLGRLAQTYKDLGAPDDLQVVVISLDPDFDTPDVINAYATGYHEDFVGLSGANTEVAEAMSAFFMGASQNADGSIGHNDVVFVLNRDAKIKFLYGSDKAADLPSNVQALLARNNW